MAWARQPDAPQFPSCPLEAIEPREERCISFVQEFGYQVGLGLIGVGSPLIVNRVYKRPLYSGIWRPVLFGIGGFYLGLWFRNFFRLRLDEKSEVLRQYINLHPEDFPPYKRVLLKDKIEPWVPVR